MWTTGLLNAFGAYEWQRHNKNKVLYKFLFAYSNWKAASDTFKKYYNSCNLSQISFVRLVGTHRICFVNHIPSCKCFQKRMARLSWRVLTAMADAVTAGLAADVVRSQTKLCLTTSRSSATSASIWLIIGSLGHWGDITFDWHASLVLHSVLRSNNPTI